MEPSRVRMNYIFLEVFIMKRTFLIVGHVTCAIAGAYMLAKSYAAEERKKGFKSGVETGRMLEALDVTLKIMESMNKKKTEETEETNKNDD